MTTWKAMGDVVMGEVILVKKDRVTIRSIDRVPFRPDRVDVRGIDERGGDVRLYTVRKDWPVRLV